jgi:hypothetical protein
MLVALPPYDPPAIVMPAPVIEVKRRRNRGSNSDNDRPQATTRPGWPTWFYVGASIVLTNDDGSEQLCTITHIAESTGQYWCDEDQ